jgi:hypothetical protein
LQAAFSGLCFARIYDSGSLDIQIATMIIMAGLKRSQRKFGRGMRSALRRNDSRDEEKDVTLKKFPDSRTGSTV